MDKRTYPIEQPIIATDSERIALMEIERVIGKPAARRNGDVPKLLGPEGQQVELPEFVSQALAQFVHYLLQGQAVTVVPLDQDLTTQQAADLLNVSRPFLIKLLEQGVIPFTKTGSHRRLATVDVLAYKLRRDAERRQSLARLTQLSQDLGLYDE